MKIMKPSMQHTIPIRERRFGAIDCHSIINRHDQLPYDRCKRYFWDKVVDAEVPPVSHQVVKWCIGTWHVMVVVQCLLPLFLTIFYSITISIPLLFAILNDFIPLLLIFHYYYTFLYYYIPLLLALVFLYY